MIAAMVLLALNAVHVHTVDGRTIPLYPGQVTFMEPSAGKGNYHPDARCKVNTTDGKHIATLEECSEIERRLRGEQQ